MPIVYVRDKNSYEIIRIEESFSSLVWTERYQEAGEFILEIPINAANFDVYKRGNYVQLGESDETMIIESLNINDEVEEPTLEVGGRTLSCILERRINASRLDESYAESVKYEGALGTVVQGIINDEFLDPKMITYSWRHKTTEGGTEEGYDSAHPSNNYKVSEKVSASYRKINNISYSNSVTGVTVAKDYSKLMSVYDILVSISKKYVTGFRVRLQNGTFVLETYKGADRTSAQKTLDPVIFNPVMDNISYVNYFEDQTDYRNIALAYSDGAWSPVDFNASFSTEIFDGYLWVTRDDETNASAYSGLGRFELAVDARSSASVTGYDPTEYYYPDYGESQDQSEYIVNKVKAVATDEFDTEDHDFIKTSEGAIDPLVRYEFGKDYFLGDTVELSNDNGVIMTAVIDEVVRSYDADGFIVTPNFKSMEDYDYGSEGDPEEGEEETA